MGTPITTRDDLRHLIDLLPESEFHTAERFLEYLIQAADETPKYTFETAPYDDEPLSDEDIAALAEADDDIRHGRVLTHEEFKARLGLS